MRGARDQEADRLRLFIGSVTDYAIYMLSPDGTVVSWNAGAQRFKGYTADEIIGQHFSRFYSAEDRAAGVPEGALRTAREQGKFEAEGWRMRKDGTRFWASVVIDPIRDEHGQLVGFAKITRDISDKRAAQEALRESEERFRLLVQMEAIGKLTGGVAHDFNNLLNVVTNGLSMLRARARDPADLRMIDAMDQAAGRGALLTQQLLSFARQQTLKQEPRDLNRVITSFEAVLRRGSRAGLQFELDLAPGLPQVMIDAAQFETALLNLVVNARDATADGGSICISTRRAELKAGQVQELPGGTYVAIAVRDTGAGMSEEVVSRAVEPFFTTKDVGKGTGLGLSQVYGMARQSGGDLHIESRPGQGTTMTMFFPALAESTARADDGDAAADKVLIVDDQPDVLEVTCELFRSLGFEVLAANSGEDAIDVLKRTPGIHLMLSDVVMPGMNGVQLGRRAQELVPGIKVILASGFANPAMAAKEDNLQGFEFLPKPYRVGDVVKRLRTLG